MEDRGADLARRTCNLELLFFVSLSCIESFSTSPSQKIYPFLSPTLMAQSAWKNCSHKLFIVILHLRTLMPLIGLLWLTNSIFRSLFYIFFPLLAFVFLPSRLAAEWHWASPCWGALLSHSSAHFRCPLSSSPRQWAFDWIHYPSCCSVCCCFSIQEKRWIINDDRQKREKKEEKIYYF